MATYRWFPNKQFVGFLRELCGKIVATANGDLKAARLISLKNKRRLQQLKKMTLKKGHWAVLITIDGKDYLLGQVLALVTVDGKINNYISKWRGDEKIEIRALCQWYDMERENRKFTGK